ncbi:Neopullulanase [Nostoc flagelliforme CCNUN1]|uniref:Neopullulanase n=1 Tax=Nostoc flagelliforme CCNUN1 TaxID=2038116 RepID=A0A2K8T452_9NOSO|nr:Neopullulanase [Nostoc flagelliforme CCNUN1]
MNLSHYSKNPYFSLQNVLENLNFSFSVLNKLKLYSTNIISGIGSCSSAKSASN